MAAENSTTDYAQHLEEHAYISEVSEILSQEINEEYKSTKT